MSGDRRVRQFVIQSFFIQAATICEKKGNIGNISDDNAVCRNCAEGTKREQCSPKYPVLNLCGNKQPLNSAVCSPCSPKLFIGVVYFFGDSGESGDRCGMMRFVVSDLSPVLSPNYCKWAVQKNTMMKVFGAAVTTVSTNYNKSMDFLFSLRFHKSDSD